MDAKTSSVTKEKRSKPRSVRVFLKKLLYILIWATLWAIIGYGVAIAIGWLVGVQTGVDVYASINNELSERDLAQILFWVSVWCLIIFLAVYIFLKRFKARSFWSISRKVLIVYIALGFFGGMAAAVYFHQTANKNFASSQANKCSIETTLSTAISATYPISTNSGSGTAFAVRQDGVLLTAYHVVGNQKTVYVDLVNGRKTAKVTSVKPAQDLALLKFSEPTPSYLPLVENVEIAEEAYSVGWPGQAFSAGYSTVSKGVISRLISNQDAKRSFSGVPKGVSFVQTDAAVNPGNSGGPLINKCGAVGMVVDISVANAYQGLPREEGISYSVSAETIKNIFVGLP